MPASAAPPPPPPRGAASFLVKGVVRMISGSMASSTNGRTNADSTNKKCYCCEICKGSETLHEKDTKIDELRQQLSKRENELQKSRHSHSELSKSNETLEGKVRKLEKKHQELTSTNNLLEAEVRNHWTWLHDSRESNDQLNLDTQRLEDGKLGAERDLFELQKVHAIQHKDLQMCRDDLFNLQPIVQQTDSEILGQYEMLCQQISNWVDNELSIFEDTTQSFSSHPQAIVEGNNVEISLFLQKAPEGGEYLVGALLHRLILGLFFQSHNTLFGLPKTVSEWIVKVMSQMAALEPKKDPSNIRAWYCDTLQATLAMSQVKEGRDQAVATASQEIFRHVRGMFPGIADDGLNLLYHNVIKRAAKLEASINLSYTTYKFSNLPPTLVPPSYNSFSREKASKFTLIDVNSRKTIKADTPMAPDGHGYIGVPLLLVEPALIRIGKDGGSTDLRKAKYLFEPCAPLPRHSQRAA